MKALSDDYEIVGVCEPNSELRSAAEKWISHDAGKKLGYEGVRWLTMKEVMSMDDLDAVIVETSELDLVDYAPKIAEKGLPIHMDKPCGNSYAKFEKLVMTMRSKDLPLHIGYMYRYNAAVKYCRELKESGRIGNIFSVEGQMSVLYTAEKRAWLKGGMMFFLGCHLVDVVCQLCGEPENVIPYNSSTMYEGIDSEDYGFAVMQYHNGISFVKACGAEVDGFSRRQIVVTGTKGTVVINPTEDNTGGPGFEMFAPRSCCSL